MVHSFTLYLFFASLFIASTLAVTPSCAADFDDHIICTSWIFNDETTSTYFGGLEDVQDAAYEQVDGVDYLTITATGIPKYDFLVTEELITELNSRPLSFRDFTTGSTTISAGDTVEFGEDIGFNGSCELNYWPPGPDCPTSTSATFTFPMDPSPAVQDCFTTLGPTGKWINGVAVYNWWDGSSFEGGNEWHILANMGELLDLDICYGHAANGNYHHHGHPNCLQNRIADDGTAASPIYGFAADGYPILGPYFSEGVKAKSCWFKRDFDDPDSPTGCGVAGARTCVLVDMYDLSQGLVDTDQAGPTTSDTVTTMSGNSFIAESGYFFEDFYYDAACTEQGEEYLDEHNGRFNTEMNTYTYHVTMDDTDGLENIFPHTIGPTFYGVVDDNTMIGCTTELFEDTRVGPGTSGPPGVDSPATEVDTPVVTPLETPVESVVTPIESVVTPVETVVVSDSISTNVATFSYQTESVSSGSSDSSSSDSGSNFSFSDVSTGFSFDDNDDNDNDDNGNDDDSSDASQSVVSVAAACAALVFFAL